jgi:hypothetical protein
VNVGTARGFAVVKWGTRDGTQEVMIDVGTGTQLTVNASTIYVDVGITDDTNIPLRLSASLGYYTGLKDEPNTFTSYIDALDGLSTFVAQRPAYASHVYFQRANLTQAYKLFFIDSRNTVIYEVDVAAGSTLNGEIKLSNDVKQIDVFNATAPGSPDNARLIWGLYL